MAKNFFKNIFNQTKNSLIKKKELNDSQKLSDIIIINNNESNFYQQKPLDKFNILSYYYPKKEKKNKKDINFLDRINELNNKFYLSQEKFTLVKSSLEKVNDDLFSNLLKQIDCYIEEIERLNKRLAIVNNDNKEEVIQKLNKKILDNEKTIRNYEHKLKENVIKEDKLTKEIEYYKKRIIFYKNKININLISRKISSENDGEVEKKEKNNNNTNINLYNNISSTIKPRYSHVRNNYFNQSSGRIIKIKHDKKLLSSNEFPSFSSNKGNNIRNKLNSKRKTFYENENIVSEFLADKESKDDSNINNRNINTVIETLDFSNDSADSINEKNNSEDLDTFENLNINENQKKLYSKKLNKNKENYIKSKLNSSEILNNKINIKEEKTNEYNSKDLSINNRNSENLNIKPNSINIKNNNSLNKSFFKQKNNLNNSTNNNTTKNKKDKVINRFNTYNNSNNNQKFEKSTNENSTKSTKNKNEKNKIIENKKEKEKEKHNYKNIEKSTSKNENNTNEEEKKINVKRKKSKSSKKIQKLIDKNKKDGKKVEVEEKDLKKVLKDINEDYDNELEMLNNQENQIKFLLNLIDVNN